MSFSARSPVPDTGVAPAVRPGQSASAAEPPWVMCAVRSPVAVTAIVPAGSIAVTPARGMVTVMARSPG
ncbi:hypothetical protein VSR01_09085 [Actinacidiphila sp. DG2A-62]|nr:hypothetical protein [Actinacidiphila sp. DG2A-62]MEC3993680.1 hypothetical protein [Actinacidiphila sp. DG2A-62]